MKRQNVWNGVSWSIAKRELRTGKRSVSLLIACLALGVAAIATVQTLAASAQDALKSQGKQLLGGDISISTTYLPLDAKIKEWLASQGGKLSQIGDLRTMAYRLDGTDGVLVELKAVDESYPLIGELRADDTQILDNHALKVRLSRKNGQFGALIESSLLTRLNLQPTDSLRIGNEIVEIRGILASESDRASSTGAFGLGARVMVSAELFEISGLKQLGSLIYYQNRVVMPPELDLDRLKVEIFREFPDYRFQWRDYRDAAPRIAAIVDRMGIFLTLVGLTALLVGGVGIATATQSYLDGKARNIALLKCLGATYNTVFWSYFLQVMLLVMVGIAIGLVIGSIAPWLLLPLITPFLPVAITPTIQPMALLVAASMGLLTAMIFSLVPLFSQRGISASSALRSQIVREPIKWRFYELAVLISLITALICLVVLPVERPLFSLIFLASIGVAMVLLYFAAKLLMGVSRWLNRPEWFIGNPGLRLALNQLHRPHSMTGTVVLSLGLGLTVMVAVALIEGNVRAQINRELPENTPLFFLIDIQRDQLADLTTQLTAQLDIGPVATMPYLRARLVEVNGKPAETMLVNPDYRWLLEGDRGVTYAAGASLSGELTSGNWWPADYDGSPLLSVHGDLARGFDLKVGDTLTVNLLGRDLTATVANIREQDWRAMQLNFTLVFSPNPLNQSPHSIIATVAGKESAAGEVQKILAQQFPNITAIRVKEALEAADKVLGIVGTAIQLNGLVAVLAGILVLASALAAGQQRRRQEMVIFKLLGATKWQIMGAFLWEYGLLGLVAGSIACILGILGAWIVITQVMNAPWVWLGLPILSVMIGGLGVSIALGIASIWRLLSQSAAPLLRNE